MPKDNTDCSHGGRYDSSSTGVTNNIDHGCVPSECSSSSPVLCLMAHWHGFLLYLNGTEPSLMLFDTPVLFLL